MGWNKSLLAFADVQQAFDRAIESNKGIKVACDSHGAAIQLRGRFNYYRKMNRIDNKSVYPLDHPMHGVSLYDRFYIRVPPKGEPDDNCVFIEIRTAENLRIEEL